MRNLLKIRFVSKLYRYRPEVNPIKCKQCRGAQFYEFYCFLKMGGGNLTFKNFFMAKARFACLFLLQRGGAVCFLHRMGHILAVLFRHAEEAPFVHFSLCFIDKGVISLFCCFSTERCALCCMLFFFFAEEVHLWVFSSSL